MLCFFLCFFTLLSHPCPSNVLLPPATVSLSFCTVLSTIHRFRFVPECLPLLVARSRSPREIGTVWVMLRGCNFSSQLAPSRQDATAAPAANWAWCWRYFLPAVVPARSATARWLQVENSAYHAHSSRSTKRACNRKPPSVLGIRGITGTLERVKSCTFCNNHIILPWRYTIGSTAPQSTAARPQAEADIPNPKTVHLGTAVVQVLALCRR